MKHFIDGDQVVITLDDFVDLQESPAVLIPVSSDDGQAVIAGGPANLSFGRYQGIFVKLKWLRTRNKERS